MPRRTIRVRIRPLPPEATHFTVRRGDETFVVEIPPRPTADAATRETPVPARDLVELDRPADG